MAKGRYVITPEQVLDAVDEDTIRVVAILGTTFTGELEPVAQICAALDKLTAGGGVDVPVHVDAASGGFVVPFLQPDLVWDFRLPRVASIKLSGHKYGLTYPGVGYGVAQSRSPARGLGVPGELPRRGHADVHPERGPSTHNDPMTSTARSSLQPLASADRPRHSGRIVVGVDGSQGSLNALLWALGEARARKIPVHAVFAWQYRPSGGDSGLGSMFPLAYTPDVPTFSDVAASVKELLDAAVSKATESDPDSATDPVRITQETVEGHAAQVLLESVSGCDLMVVGSHGHGGFVGTMLGSVSHQLVSHSRCPVVVVPAPQRAAKG